MPRVVRQVGVHLANDVDWTIDHGRDAIDVGTPEPLVRVSVHHLDPSRILARKRVSDSARSIGRLIVDHQQADVRVLHQGGCKEGQIVALVVGRHDHQRCRRRHDWRPSNRSDEICSETSPTSRMTTLSRISSTDEFVTCDCVMIVHTAYPAPMRNAAALTGRKRRSGLKIVITFSRIRKNWTPSGPSRIFETPSRCAASTGSKRTLYPAFMNASVVVVGVEKPLGSRWMNSPRHSRRAARNH